MVEKIEGALTLQEGQIKKITELDPKNGLDYAQWGIMRTIDESNGSYSEWQKERGQRKKNQEPPIEQRSSWLVQPTEDQRLGPVGFVGEERKE